MRLLHVADVHLGTSYSGFGDMAAARADEVLAAFRRIPDVAAEERVDAVLFAGDLFDGPRPASDTMAAVRDTLRRLVDLCLPVFMVPGNHDAITLRLDPYRELARGSRVVVQADGERPERPWPIADERGRRLAEKHSVYILAAPRFGEPVRVETDGGELHVYGVAYDPAACDAPLETLRRVSDRGLHVALLHASVREADHWSSSGSSLSITPDELRAMDVDYLALGDHHGPRLPDDFDGVPACYSGSFAACDLTETGPRGYALVTLEPGRAPRVEHRDAGVVPVERVELDVTPFTDDVQVAEALYRALPERVVPVARLTGEPPFPLDAGAVEVELAERYGHARVIDESRYFASGRLDDLAARDTVVGHVVRLGRERVRAAADEQARAVAERALRAALRALEVD